jgi:hypothetical protein
MNYTPIAFLLIARSGDFCIDEIVFHCQVIHIVSRLLAILPTEQASSTEGSRRKRNPRPEIALLAINPLDNGGCRDSLSESFATV